MYNLESIKVEDLSKVQIKNQAEIIERTGYKLDLKKAYEIVKADTKGFSMELEEAKKVDELFMQLLERKKDKTNSSGSSKKTSQKHYQMQERERLRMLDLLELELQLAT